MVLLMGITIPAGLEIVYNKTLKMYDISVMCNVGKNPRFFPRSKKMTLREVTYLFQVAYAWNALSDEVKAEWNYAANIIGQHSYNLYVQDKCYRIKHEIGGNATPSIYHQYLVGHLSVQAPASGAQIVQYNKTRVNFPASFEIGFKSDLAADGPDPYARLRFIWTRYYGGQNILSTETIDLPLVSGWDKRKQSIFYHKGIRGKWQLELELHDVTGDFWFDNLWAFYSGEVKANDPYCEDVIKWWEAVNLPEGANLETVYPTGGAL